MQKFLAANPKNKHGVHSYTLEQFGFRIAVQMTAQMQDGHRDGSLDL